MAETLFSSRWDDDGRTLHTRISGQPTKEDALQWKAGLEREAEKIPPLSDFKMLVDIRGYEVADVNQEVHQIQREVIPRLLGTFGYRVAYLKLFEVPEDFAQPTRSAICRALAHVHHDCGKMDTYNQNISEPHERFFCDLGEAESWLASFR